jgi:hypothetical protein
MKYATDAMFISGIEKNPYSMHSVSGTPGIPERMERFKIFT